MLRQLEERLKSDQIVGDLPESEKDQVRKAEESGVEATEGTGEG
jgi:hypothetical protein